MACSLRFDLLVIVGTVLRRCARLGCACADYLRASSTTNNHANVDRIILMRYVETARSHDVDVGVHRQVLWQHVLLLNDDLLVVELHRGSLQRCLLRKYRWLRRAAIFYGSAMSAGDAGVSASLPQVLWMGWVDQRVLLIDQLLVIFTISISVQFGQVLVWTLTEGVLLVFEVSLACQLDDLLRWQSIRCYLRLCLKLRCVLALCMARSIKYVDRNQVWIALE